MIGVSAGEGIGDGSSRIGERHLLIEEFAPGISNRILGGCKWADPAPDLCTLRLSSTGTSVVLCLK